MSTSVAVAATPIPREHGAWGILLQPFLAAAVIAGAWNWFLLPGLLSILLLFLMREPLLVLARQRWVWRTPHAEAEDARRWLWIEGGLLVLCGAILLAALPFTLLAFLGVMAAGLTGFAVWMTVRNKQRSMALQVISAFGLSASAFLPAALQDTEGFARWIWPLWALHALHSTAGIFAVHARLEARMGRQGHAGTMALSVLVVNGILGIAAAALGQWHLALPLQFSVAGTGWEMLRLRNPEALREPLKRVGFRNLGLSLVFTTLVIVMFSRLPV
jgi:hypothetical protein